MVTTSGDRRLQAAADRVEIEALRGEFVDAGMRRDLDHFVTLFAPDAVWRIPVVNAEFTGREEIRAGVSQLVEGFLGLPASSYACGHDRARRRHRDRPRVRPDCRPDT